MPTRTMAETLDALGDERLCEFDAVVREGHATYRAYDPAILVEHDARAQANCTYSHVVAAADRRFMGRSGVRVLDVRGLKLWLFEDANVVIRWKKMDEDGRSRNYPTKQAKAYDAQLELPGLPPAPVRLTFGYLLDATKVELVRSQIARPHGREAMWCGAVIPEESRVPGKRVWTDVTRQRGFA